MNDVPTLCQYNFVNGTHRPLAQCHHLAAGYKSPLHWHDFYELEFVLSGNGQHSLDGKIASLSPGTAYIMTPNHFHIIQADDAMDIINFSFDRSAVSNDICQKLILSEGNDFYDFSQDLDFFRKLLNMAICEYENHPHDCGILITQDILEIVLLQFFRKSAYCPPSSISTIVQKAVTEIQIHFREPITLQSAAKTLFISPNYLGRVFNREIGQTFRNYLCMTRLRYCCDLLCSTDLSVQDIALEGGFHNVEYFDTVFRKIMFQSPLSYRKYHSQTSD